MKLKQLNIKDHMYQACERNDIVLFARILSSKQFDIAEIKQIVGKDCDSTTTAILIAENGHSDMLAVFLILLRKMIPDTVWLSQYLHLYDERGLTCTHWCALKGHISCFAVISCLEPELLLCTDRSGVTPMELARAVNQVAAVQFLEHQLQTTGKSNADTRLKRRWSFAKCVDSVLSKKFFERLMTELPCYSFLASLLSAATLSLYLIVHDIMSESGTPSKVVTQILNVAAQCVTWRLAWLAHSTDPGSIARVPTMESAGTSRGSKTYTAALHRICTEVVSGRVPASHLYCCHRCRLYRPLRAGHGQLTKRCIPQYDHFCYFLWCDVGRDNYSYFFLFLCCMSLLALPLFMRLCVHHLQQAGQWSLGGATAQSLDRAGNVRINAAHSLFTALVILLMKAFLVWCASVWFLISVLLAVHCRMTALGTTTREYYGGVEKYPYLLRRRSIGVADQHSRQGSVKVAGTVVGWWGDWWLRHFYDKFYPLPDNECFDDTSVDEMERRSIERWNSWWVLFCKRPLRLQCYSGCDRDADPVDVHVGNRYTV